MFGDELFKDEMTKEEREIKQHLFEDQQQQQLEANVEKLSKYIEEPLDEYEEGKIMDIRMQVINISVITDTLCKTMYECIENDLLGPLQFSVHNISPYQSKGIEKAVELTVGRSSKAISNQCPKVDDQTNGGKTESDQPSASGTSDESGCPSRKRARKGGFGGSLIDLNLPAEAIGRN